MTKSTDSHNTIKLKQPAITCYIIAKKTHANNYTTKQATNTNTSNESNIKQWINNNRITTLKLTAAKVIGRGQLLCYPNLHTQIVQLVLGVPNFCNASLKKSNYHTDMKKIKGHTIH